MWPCAIHLRPCEVLCAWPLQGRLQGRSYRLAASALLLLRRAVMALAVGGAVTPDFANLMTQPGGVPCHRRAAPRRARRGYLRVGTAAAVDSATEAHVRARSGGRILQRRS